ncbi:MAG: signal peptidase I [Ruminococcus sp.]|nr:signal peptidase I [Ruminococcus sp.]
MESKKKMDLPTAEQLEQELKRLKYRHSFAFTLRSTVASLIVVAAIAVMISTMIMPVLRVTGTSMTPTLQNDQVIICNKLAECQKGDVVAFYYNNKILIKRVIGVAGDVIDISGDGVVSVNGEPLDEPYVSELALGECDIELPYQVPDNRIFVMGDHRSVSIDSRSTSVGCVAIENVIGKVLLRVYPIDSFGKI